MLQVAAYCRVSTDKEDQANSFEAQQRYFREYIQRQPDWELQGIYADEGFSGTSTNKRVEFNKMLHAAELGQIDLIVTKEVSRFTRNTVDALQITRELRRRGVGVLFLNDSLDTRTNDGELRLTIMSSFAQDESRRTSERSKWGQMRSMEKGVVFGGSLLGYDVIGGKMTVNPEGAEVVRLIFHKYLQERKGCSTIARELREAGILSSKGNCLWSSATVTKILKNEKYCGDLIQKKTYTPDYLTHEKKYNHGKEPLVELKDHHEPIIDRETWQAGAVPPQPCDRLRRTRQPLSALRQNSLRRVRQELLSPYQKAAGRQLLLPLVLLHRHQRGPAPHGRSRKLFGMQRRPPNTGGCSYGHPAALCGRRDAG